MTELILNKRIRQNKKQTQNRINPKQTYQTPSKRKPRVLKPWPLTSLPQDETIALTTARLKLLCLMTELRCNSPQTSLLLCLATTEPQIRILA